MHSGDAPGNHTLYTYLRVGNAPDGLTRTFIKTGLPTITDGTVYSAKLLLSNTSGSSTFQNISVYRMDSSWTSSGIYWNSHELLPKTLIASNIPVSAYTNSPSAHRYVCDITDTVQDFYKSTRINYGFMVRYTNESITDYNAFYSSDCGIANVMPCLYINYVYDQTSGITNGGIYYIKNKRSGNYLDVSGAGTSNGTDVIQWQFHGGTNQQWKAIYAGNGLYRFQAMNTTDKYLETESYTNANEVNVDISNASLSRQKWSILSNGNGSYRILSECSNLTKGVTVEGASYSNGADVFQYTYTGSGSAENDDWVFEEINSLLFPKISSLHQCARNYDSDIDISSMLLFQFIRSANSSYTTSNFDEVAGEVDQGFRNYVSTNNSSLNFLSQNLIEISDTEYGPVDFTHLAATTNAILFDSTSFRSILVGEKKVNDLSGWAGDFQTLVIDTINATNSTSNYTTFYNTFLSLLGSDEASFSMKDILADFDAFYLASNIAPAPLFGSQLEYYYSNLSENRFDYFVGTRTFNELKADLSIYANNNFIIGIQWPLYSGYTVTSVQSQAAADAFAFYLWSIK